MGMLRAIEKALEVFDKMRLREAVTIYEHLKLHSLTMEDLAQYISLDLAEEKRRCEADEAEHKRKIEEARRKWCETAPRCPECAGCLSLKHICKKKGPENIHGYTCLWYCENGDCIYENYTYQNAREFIRGQRKQTN